MYRFWSVFFALLPIACTAFFGYSWYSASLDPMNHWWFPENVSSVGGEIDGLFMLILGATTFTFLLCNVLLVVYMWKYAADKEEHDEPPIYTHGSHKVEIGAALATALTLGFLAVSQIPTWTKIKFPDSTSMKEAKEIARVTARQFEWRMTYPGPDGVFDTIDDFESNSVLVIPANTPVKIRLESKDVLHSFFLPNFRIKQDAVPGMSIPVWFEGRKIGEYDLVCAELCGWGHYKMKARIVVKSPADYREWLENKAEKMRAASED